MKNSTVLPVVAGDVGPTVMTSDLAARKTIIATNIAGSIVIEASADGVNFCDVASMNATSDDRVIIAAASHMRVRATAGNASSVNVVAEQGLIRAALLPLPPPPASGPGASVDVSTFGSVTTLYVEKAPGSGSIDIQISGDSINWATFRSFPTSRCITEDISTRFVRAVTNNGAAGIAAVAAEEPAARALNSPAPAFVFRPGGVAGGNLYTSWARLVAAMSSVQGRKMLEFDDSIATPCVIPPGTWPMKDVVWCGYGPRSNPGVFRTVVDITEGAVFTNLRMIGGQITIRNRATSVSPISDFGAGPNHVHIGMRDDCGNTQLMNLGEAAMFNLGSRPALFFVQNSLLGVGSTHPLIEHTADTIILNLIGQNQTGAKLVRSAPGAKVLFGALSCAAQVASDQTSITNSGGEVDFGPVGRIQRKVLPMTPAPAATSNITGFDKPNALLRCNGNGTDGTGFTQFLPSITKGFFFGFDPNQTAIYTGGQEIVVAEVSGGKELRVKPSDGDTIDGLTRGVRIKSHGSRTFVSDGRKNWITTAVHAGRPSSLLPSPDFRPPLPTPP